MVSYFAPRGRLLIKAGNLRQAQQQQQQHHKQFQQVQQQSVKWPMLQQFRKTFSTKSNNATTENKNLYISNAPKHNKSNNNNGSSFTTAGNLAARARSQQDQQQKQRSAFVRWTNFLLRFAPVGFCVFGAIEWQLHKQKCEREKIPRRASSLQTRVYCWLPLRLLSRCWGWLAACHVPTTLRPYVYGFYSSAFNVNIDEAADNDYKHYESLAQFFTRPLRAEVRPIDKHAAIVSPADGKVLHFGSAANSLIEQVKGVDYSIESFLGPANWRKEQREHEQKQLADYEAAIKEHKDNSTALYQCVIYLAPGDYHRFHSPVQWKPKLRRHFAGELLSVNPRVAHWLPGLFCLNERALYLGKWQHGFFSYTAVGATNVGSVQIYIDEKLKTNKWMGLKVGAHKQTEAFDELRLPADVSFEKGQLVGQFNMGSTIVLLFEAPKNFKFSIEAGQRLRVGEPIGYIGKKN